MLVETKYKMSVVKNMKLKTLFRYFYNNYDKADDLNFLKLHQLSIE